MRLQTNRLIPLLLIAAACRQGDDPSTTPTDLAAPSESRVHAAVPAPAGLVSVSFGGQNYAIWPYLNPNLSAVGQDPVNLIFKGAADPREIRSALFALDGNRTGFGFPAGAPFDCTWSDAVGSLQAGYSEEAGWTGSALQLQCGTFAPIRFHLRLFQAGGITLGGVHFEVQIPGTTDHQVLSWELAEQLVTADLARTGLLGAAPAQTATISAAPTFRSIPPIIYNGLPDGLKQLAGGPLGSVTAPVGIATDGRATELLLAGRATEAGDATQTFTIQFGQVIPRPFCALSPDEYLYVTGPVEFQKTVQRNREGGLETKYRAAGFLTVVPIDPLTGQPSGLPYSAAVGEDQTTSTATGRSAISGNLEQRELPAGPGHGRLVETIQLSRDRGKYDLDVKCVPLDAQ